MGKRVRPWVHLSQLLGILIFGSCGEDGVQKNETIEEEVRVGGPCDGCELIYEGMPQQINSIDTSLDWYTASKKLTINGSVESQENGNPVSGVIIYYWHTDSLGIYSKATDQTQGRRHGKLRGWVMTDKNGKFQIYTSFPAAYPNSSIPSHVHVVVKEEGFSEYYIDAWEFMGDPFLDPGSRNARTARGGLGILELDTTDSGFVTRPKIILGLNIPDYQEP